MENKIKMHKTTFHITPWLISSWNAEHTRTKKTRKSISKHESTSTCTYSSFFLVLKLWNLIFSPKSPRSGLHFSLGRKKGSKKSIWKSCNALKTMLTVFLSMNRGIRKRWWQKIKKERTKNGSIFHVFVLRKGGFCSWSWSHSAKNTPFFANFVPFFQHWSRLTVSNALGPAVQVNSWNFLT